MPKNILTLLALLFTSISANAAVITSSNLADFILVAEPFADNAGTAGDLVSTSGDVTLQSAGVGAPPSSTQFYGPAWTTALAGSEYAISGDENFDVLFSSSQTAFAFNYADDSVASTFTLGFFDGASQVGSASFTTSTFDTAEFIGFISDTSFDSVQIREDDGANNSNEYFQFYSAAPSEVPLPAAAWLFISALGGLIVAKRKR